MKMRIQFIMLAILCQIGIISADELPIKIGSSLALTGDNSSTGLNLKNGIEAYFAKINAEGGIDGKKLEFIALDDGNDSLNAAANARQLIDKDQVIALLANTGTPTTRIVLPILYEKKVNLFAPHSGSEFFHKVPSDRYIFNFRASYNEEMAQGIKSLLEMGIKPNQMAFLIEKNPFGESYYSGAMKTLKEMGYPNPETLPHGYYNRSTVNVEYGIAKILSEARISGNKLKVIFLITLDNSTKVEDNLNIKIIKLFQSSNKVDGAIFFFPNVSISTLVSNPNIQVKENKIFSFFGVPFGSNLPGVKEYEESMKKYFPNAELNQKSLEGYLAAKLFVMGLKKAAKENNLTREGIIDSLETLHDIDLGIGVNVGFNKNDHDALHILWPIVYENGKFIIRDWEK